MTSAKDCLLVICILFVAVGAVLALAWMSVTEPTGYEGMRIALETTTATSGTLLGIITAGLMFTQGKFSELASELAEKSPHYLFGALSLERIQSIEMRLHMLEKTFTSIAATTTIVEETGLYRRISRKASLMFVDFAVILNLKLRQQGLPETSLVLSEMDTNLYKVYQKRKKEVRKEWEIFVLIKQIMDTWEGTPVILFKKSNTELGLENDLKSALAVLNLKESMNEGSTNINQKVAEIMSDLSKEIGRISNRLHKDKVPLLLPQMQQASALRGKYFFSALSLIAAPLILNLLIMPQLSVTNASLFQPVISITSLLSVLGVIFLLLYVYKILSV